MVHLQEQHSSLRIAVNAFSRKRVAFDDFEGFSIRINDIYCPSRQVDKFEHAFAHPNLLPSFGFIAAFPVVLQCLSQCPIPSYLLGLIHLSSEFLVFGTHNWLLPTDIEVSIEKEIQDDKGKAYLLTTRFYQHDKLTLTNTNRLLDKNKRYQRGKTKSNKYKENTIGKCLDTTRIGKKTALTYALLSRDFNPIHLHPWLAKRFGLKSSLIHGMFNAHFSLASLHRHKRLIGNYIRIDFNRPCFIGSQVFLRPYGETNEYGLFAGDVSVRFLRILLEDKTQVGTEPLEKFEKESK